MSVTVQIGTNTYEYPVNGTEAGRYGEDASAAFVALADKVNTISSNYDILTTTATISNNISTDTAVTGLSFSASLVKAAEITYYLTRTTREYGKLFVSYNGSSWDLSQGDVVGDCDVAFDINSSGQVVYQSSNDIAGTCKFSAKVVEV